MADADTEDPKAPSALIVVDMISPYDFPDAEEVVRRAQEPVQRMAELVERARSEGTKVIWANDNYGDFNSSSEELVQRALEGEHPELVEPLRPGDDDAFVIKLRHSAFYTTPLEYLLATQELGRIVLVGQVTEQCILYTAHDAYLRNFRVAVASDAVVGIDDELSAAALKMMERNIGADVEPARDISLA
jgi:nicotinamidase-related amidase